MGQCGNKFEFDALVAEEPMKMLNDGRWMGEPSCCQIAAFSSDNHSMLEW